MTGSLALQIHWTVAGLAPTLFVCFGAVDPVDQRP